MLKRIVVIIVLTGTAFAFFPLAWGVADAAELSPLARQYTINGPEELGTANLVTAVVVSYRGLDTLGEVTVLFAAAAGAALILTGAAGGRRSTGAAGQREPDAGAAGETRSTGAAGQRAPDAAAASQPEADSAYTRRRGSELLASGAAFLFPIIWLFGIYIFANGHLTPGGGFQGGVVIASAVLLLVFSDCRRELSHRILQITEALSGAAYAATGLLGIWLAAGFLDPRFLPVGEFGQLFSAGAIPLIYTFVGFKVGAELTGIVDAMRGCS